MRDGDNVRDLDHPDSWWSWHTLEWWQRASNGLDAYGCEVSAWIERGGLRIQHGENPEHTRWFSLDALNQLGERFTDRSPTARWFDAIHRRMAPS